MSESESERGHPPSQQKSEQTVARRLRSARGPVPWEQSAAVRTDLSQKQVRNLLFCIWVVLVPVEVGAQAPQKPR